MLRIRRAELTMIEWIKLKINGWRQARSRRLRLKKLRKMDPFIYD